MEIKYTNPTAIRRVFAKDSVVVLNEFFDKTSFENLKHVIMNTKFKKDRSLLHHSCQAATININSRELVEFLSAITSTKTKKIQFRALKLTWKDYSILHDRYLEKPGIDVIINLTEKWNLAWGGLVTYTDGSGNYTQIPATENSVAFVNRKKGMNKFIQYVNHYGKGKERILLIGKL